MQTDFFINLLLEVKDFENSDAYKPNCNVEDFRVWMNDKKYAEESPTKLFKNENHQVSFTENEIFHITIGFVGVRIFKIFYFKQKIDKKISLHSLNLR